jgi:hypothetical protein
MATKIYESAIVETVYGEKIYIIPLKIKYLRLFMDRFDEAKGSQTSDELLWHILECTVIAMQQYAPHIKTAEAVEDLFDIKTVYKILDIAAGIKMDPQKQEETTEVKQEDIKQTNTWDTMDLAKLEAEVFQLGIWKDYEELESSLSMSEITATLEAKREQDYADKKFFAAIQGVDLDKQTKKEDPWEAMKARVFSGGAAKDSNDVLALQGYNATKAGFGIGMGLSYEKWD